jgi:hypothetical protein
MEESPSIILSFLDKSIHEIMAHSGFMTRLGLYDGKIGVSLLLYYYSRCNQNKEIEAYAGHLIDEVFKTIAEGNPPNLVSDIGNIAWTICHLTERHFIEAELNEVLEDIDSFLWPSCDTAFDFANIHNLANVGLYIIERINAVRCQNVWCEKGLAWLKEVEMLVRKNGCPSISLLYSVHMCFRALQQCEIQSHKRGYLFNNMSSFIKTAYYNTSNCDTDKYLLNALSNWKILDLSVNLLPVSYWTPSLLNVNKFYLYRLLYGNFGVPDNLDPGIFSIASDEKRMNDLLSSANPENIGLNHYLGGLSWALLQHCIKQGSFSYTENTEIIPHRWESSTESV